jgi:hypothetical protein
MRLDKPGFAGSAVTGLPETGLIGPIINQTVQMW